MICTSTRALLLGWVAGVLVGDFASSALVGWVAGLAVAAVVYLAQTRGLWPARGGCSLPACETQPEDDATEPAPIGPERSEAEPAERTVSERG